VDSRQRAALCLRHGGPDRLTLVGDILAVTAGTAAAADLMSWSNANDPQVRAAAIGALGTIGLDDRGFYFALRALDDDQAMVRAMAARALGRSGRDDAVEYLETKLVAIGGVQP